MKKRISVFVVIFLLTAFAGALAYGFVHRDELLRKALVRGINASTHEYFRGTVRLRSVHLDKTMKLIIKGFYGELLTEGGSLPLEIGQITSVDPVWHLALARPFRLDFEGARVSGSGDEGLKGRALVDLGKDWSAEIRAEIADLGLDSIEKLSPDNLEGSTGSMRGTFYFHSSAGANDFRLELIVKEPGGMIQSRFFDVLLPYLPQIPDRARIETISGSAKLVPYRAADLEMKLVDPSRMKVFFHILVPDYNLNLNLNVEIRVDRENAFFQIAQLFGLIKVAGGSASLQGMAA